MEWIVLAGTTTLMSTSVACQLTVDRAEVEKVVTEQLKTKNFTLKTVTCPDKLAPKKGESVECTATDDEDVAGKIKLTWGEGTKFDIDPQNTMDLQAAATQMNDLLSKQVSSKVEIKCPTKVIFIKEGKKFTCDATVESFPGVAHKVDFTMKDGEGKLGSSLRPASEAAKD